MWSHCLAAICGYTSGARQPTLDNLLFISLVFIKHHKSWNNSYAS